MSVRKAVITAAGLGTRLLPATKEMPKEMLPIYSVVSNGAIVLKPILHVIFEELFNVGIRQFCFVVGRGKRSIEDYFTPDYNYVDVLERRGKNKEASALREFYKMVDSSVIVFVNQPEPRGFGDAVLKAEACVGDEPFILHAGDTFIFTNGGSYARKILSLFEAGRPKAVLTLKKMPRPTKMYGYAVVEEESNRLIVKRVVEKPDIPPSDLAIMAVYVFDPDIFESIREVGPGVGGEIQLTDAIQRLIDKGGLVEAVILRDDELYFDVGSPETYWDALRVSYEQAARWRI
ncbi:sugar phosphate nucleotidyltransferase [Pyrobaculum sp.]|uniref:UTP--glucose-1-phosphate uridylyltransferase n=2 Tax=Pyrobaculum sp. TaxID=2004705 RepID=UPI003172CF6A